MQGTGDNNGDRIAVSAFMRLALEQGLQAGKGG